jgi:hypothetical protein
MMFSCFQLEPVTYYMQLFSIWISDLCFAGLTNFLHDSMYGVPACGLKISMAANLNIPVFSSTSL